MSAPRIALIVVALAGTASAETDTPEPPPDARAPFFSVHRIYARAGVLHVAPLSDSSELRLAGVDGPASLAVMDGPIAGSGAAIDAMTKPAVILGYRLPWLGGRLSVETVLSTPLHVTFRATGTLASMSIAPEALGLPTGVPALGSQMGEADAAPPLVTLVYRIAELGPLRPYAGAGVSVMVTYNARATNPVLTEAGEPRFEIDPAPGLALQAGFDLAVWRNIVARVDVKYIAFMKAHATVSNIRVRTPGLPLLENAEVGSATMDLWVNPLIVQVGLGIDL